MLILAAITGFAVVWALNAGGYLITDAPRPSDVILVLAGETDARPRRALQLLDQGYARRVILDVPNNANFFGTSLTQLAADYIRRLPQGARVDVCPIDGLSTRDEATDAERCLQAEGAKSVLLVTSDFHTRRALAVFRHQFPAHEYSVAASRNPEQYGAHWWKHRQWAKVFQEEWMKVIWWNLVDRWRGSGQ